MDEYGGRKMKIETKYDIGEKVWLRCSNGLNYHTEIVGITITEDMTPRYQFRGAINYREEHELFATEEELINSFTF